ncbi:MAG: hydroxyacid dehydrogenase [bacterium]
MNKPKVALFAPDWAVEKVFDESHLRKIKERCELIDLRFKNSIDTQSQLSGIDYILSSWGMPLMNEEFFSHANSLKGVFYAAGSVKGFVTDEVWKRGVIISSAAIVNAIPVAEYTLGVILLANKRFFQTAAGIKEYHAMPGNYRSSIGIISASLVGRQVMKLLANFEFEISLYDPFVTEEEALALGAKKVSLEDVMKCNIVSLHAPNLPQLYKLINANLFSLMPEGATFINTARGALVDEAALLNELQSGRIYAVLDVTEPEPPVADSPFYTLKNCIYTPHIAGSLGDECKRMASFEIDEMFRVIDGKKLRNQVTADIVSRLA